MHHNEINDDDHELEDRESTGESQSYSLELLSDIIDHATGSIIRSFCDRVLRNESGRQHDEYDYEIFDCS